eukprot:m.113819 g.113819  ORF g.113819 m.113819 type:complete len:138 (+) comp15361_c0_seq11:3847-4260(+)
MNALIPVETHLSWLGNTRWQTSKFSIKIAEPFVSSSISTPNSRPDANDKLTYTVIVNHSETSSSPIYRATTLIVTPPEVLLQLSSINIDSASTLAPTPALHLLNASAFEVSLADSEMALMLLAATLERRACTRTQPN